MSEIQKSGGSLPMVPTDPSMAGVSAALGTLREALNAGVEISRTRELGRTQRAAILAQKEVQITQICENIKKDMANDRLKHEERIDLIQIIRETVVPNATVLTPEIVSVVQGLLQSLKE